MGSASVPIPPEDAEDDEVEAAKLAAVAEIKMGDEMWGVEVGVDGEVVMFEFDDVDVIFYNFQWMWLQKRSPLEVDSDSSFIQELEHDTQKTEENNSRLI